MITPSFGLTATERVLPRLALDFTTASLDPRITFTRAGATATVVDSSGVIQSVAADTPRFDYNPITLACNGLLIEESRTNTFQYTIAFTTGYWSFGDVTGVVGQTSPDGTGDGTKLEEVATTANHQINRAAITLSASTAHTISIFLKAAERDKFAIVTTSDGIATQRSTIDLTAQTNSNGTITNFGNGWFRVTQTFTTSAGTNTQVRFRLVDASGNESYLGVLGYGLYIWGAQLEVGAFSTSYIPTTTTALTRNADVASMTGTNFSDWYNATQGTFAAKGTRFAIGLVTNILGVSDGTSSNRLRFYQETNNRITVNSSVVGTVTTGNGAAAYGVAGAYSSNGIAAACNGGSVASSVAGAVPTGITSMDIGRNTPGGAITLNGWLQSIRYWPQRLTNAELQAFSK